MCAGHQRNVLDTMQTRAELYDTIGYHQYEQKLDQLFGKDADTAAQAPKSKL